MGKAPETISTTVYFIRHGKRPRPPRRSAQRPTRVRPSLVARRHVRVEPAEGVAGPEGRRHAACSRSPVRRRAQLRPSSRGAHGRAAHGGVWRRLARRHQSNAARGQPAAGVQPGRLRGPAQGRDFRAAVFRALPPPRRPAARDAHSHRLL
eukprot:5842530-Prymnesium_polylepis.1